MPSGGRKHISMYTQVYHQSASRSEVIRSLSIIVQADLQVIYVLHPPTLTSPKMKSTLVSPPSTEVPKETVQTFGFRTQFGGGKSTGFALIYDSEADLKKFEVTPKTAPMQITSSPANPCLGGADTCLV